MVESTPSDDWLRANVTPIFESRGRFEPTEYWLLNFIIVSCNLLARIVRCQMKDILNVDDIWKTKLYIVFLCNLFSFTSERVSISEYLIWKAKQNEVIFFDFRRAFDILPQRRVLGIKDEPNKNGSAFKGNNILAL